MSSPHSLRIPRALSLLIVAQLVLQVPVLAQGEAAPGWNEEKDIMSTFSSVDKKVEAPKTAEPAKSEAQPIKSEAQSSKSEAQSIKSEAQSIKSEAQSSKSEAVVETQTTDAKSEVKADSGRGSDAAAGKEIAEIEKILPVPSADALILQGTGLTGAQSTAKGEEKNPPTAASTPAASTDTTQASEVLVVDTDEAGAATKSAQSAVADKITQPVTEGASTASITAPAAITLPTATQGGILSIPSEATPPTVGTINTADQLSPDLVHQLGATVSTVLGTVNAAQTAAQEEVVVVDCDENTEVEKVVEYESLPTDEGKTRIKSGARFPVIVTSQISSKTAKKGDPLEARLKYDLKVGDRLVAKKGSVVRGHINYSLRARSVMHSLVSPERWYRNSGCLGVEFDEILSEKGEHIPLVACPAKTARIVKNKGEGRVLGVNHLGQVTGPWSQQLKYKALRIGLNAALAPAGAFSFGAMPVALGVIGAANPSFAFMKPVGTNVRHRRIKGFAWGFLSGIPGSFLIEDTVTRGQEAIIKPGDEFLAEFKEEFTGEPASEAELMPNAHVKVHGDVRTSGKKK